MVGGAADVTSKITPLRAGCGRDGRRSRPGVSPIAAAFGNVTRPQKCHNERWKIRENRNRKNPGVLHLFLVKRKGRGSEEERR